ncbi:helix-turn-helix domain-containing protein [Nonomuraea sp. NPDC049419]|uniref:helix-turn-helix domain-containing protein n=1 Tax=Nonomuraea sp. NPDC049419 TaxID=3155772 RepID=UPI003435D3BB
MRRVNPAEQERRERLRLQAAEWFEDAHGTRQIARELRVHERTVARWRKSWREDGIEALRSKGPVSRAEPRTSRRAEMIGGSVPAPKSPPNGGRRRQEELTRS